MSSEFSLQEPFHFQVVHCFNPMKNFLECLGSNRNRNFRPSRRSLGKEAWCLKFRLDCVRRRSDFGSLSSRNFNRRRSFCALESLPIQRENSMATRVMRRRDSRSCERRWTAAWRIPETNLCQFLYGISGLAARAALYFVPMFHALKVYSILVPPLVFSTATPIFLRVWTNSSSEPASPCGERPCLLLGASMKSQTQFSSAAGLENMMVCMFQLPNLAWSSFCLAYIIRGAGRTRPCKCIRLSPRLIPKKTRIESDSVIC